MHQVGIIPKLVGLASLTVATGLNTGWVQLIAVGGVVLAAAAAARLPLRALPRLPPWLIVLTLAGLLFAVAGGGVGRYLRLVAFSLLFVLLSLLIAWTTDLGELAAALSRLGAPLRRLGLPVDEWALTAALSVRCLPLITDEIRTVIAAHRQRPAGRDPAQALVAVVDLATASMAAGIRRASDLGEAIATRGGTITAPRLPLRLGVRDIAALALVAAASVLPGVLT